MLDQIKIASPCTADWDRMEGTDRVRFCGECKKNVFNLSAMTRREAEALLQETNGNLCTRLYRRADGTVLTEDCPVGLRAKLSRVSKRISWFAAGAFGLAATAFGQSAAVLSGRVTYDGTHSIANVTVIVTDPQTGKSTEAKASPDGAFRIATLEAGVYTVTAASSGFSSFRDDHVVVPRSGEIRLNIKLLIGTVGGAAVAVDLDTGKMPIPATLDLPALPSPDMFPGLKMTHETWWRRIFH